MASIDGCSRIPSAIPLELEGKKLEDLVLKLKDWAIMHGAAMRSKTNFSTDSVQFAPFTLVPSAFPKREFYKAVAMQTVFNEIIHKVAHNRQLLTETLKSTIEADDFTRNLFRIYETVLDEGITQRLSLGLLRADYLLHASQNNVVVHQVEVNTIASSFCGIATQVSLLHRIALQELDQVDKLNQLPENNALNGLCQGMVEAWKLYNKPMAVILIVVEDVSYNICDQRFHEFEVQKINAALKVLRKTFTQLKDEASLGTGKELIVDGKEVAVVYYRSGYVPEQYANQADWDTRLLIERSLAIKCPSIQYHLAGTKKVQQVLANPKILEKLVDNKETIESIQQIFTGIYSLDLNEEGDSALKMAVAEPARFVLKPQREGGGNNVYGENIRQKLVGMQESEDRKAWILMDRIFPPVQRNILVRPGQNSFIPVDIVSELGIYGVIIGDAEKILINKGAGHMLRSKLSDADEGGVAAGAGVLDSPFLV